MFERIVLRKIVDLFSLMNKIQIITFGGCSDSDDLHHILLGVGQSPDNQQPVQQVQRNAMRRVDVLSTPDQALATVGGEDHDGGNGGFKGAMEVGKTFNVKHVDFINEKNSGNKFG